MAAGSIVVSLLMKTGAFETDTKRAEARMKALERQAEKAGKVIGTAVAAGATLAVAGLVMMINKQRDVIDAQAKMAQQLGTSYSSLANLERAGQLAGVGMDQVAAASRQLDLNIGKAIQGSKAQEEAFKRLGISAEDLADMPLDERLATINKALRDNIDASERSAVAADIFGAKNAAAIQMLDAGTIADASKQVALFGLNLSDIDVAKVEMANDAFSTIDLAVDGLQKQLTVALAPALKFIGDEFLNAVEEAGGFGTIVPSAVDKTIRALGFVINAGNGVIRAFDLSLETGRLMAYGVSGLMLKLTDTIINGPVAGVNMLIEQMNRIPGVELGPLPALGLGVAIQRDLAAAEAGFEATKERIADLLLKPLAGDRMVAAWERALESAQQAAEGVVAGRTRGGTKPANDTIDPNKPKNTVLTEAQRTYEVLQKQIHALEVQAATFNLNEKETKLYTMALDGATEAQLRQASGLLATLEAIEKVAEEQARLNAFLDPPPTAKLEKQRDDMQFLAQAYQLGTINAQQYFEAVDVALNRTADVAAAVNDQMSVFAEQAGRNIQDAFAQFLFDPFENGVMGMLSGFANAVQQMVAQAVAADLANRLGGWGNSNSGAGGFLGGIAGAAGAVFGGARANGGDVFGDRAYLVGEQGPEMFVPRTAGTVLPNSALPSSREGGRPVQIIQYIQPGTPQEVRRAAAGGARDGLAALAGAERYR